MAILVILSLFFRSETDHNARIPANAIIDKIVVFKSERKLVAYTGEKEVAAYKVALGRNPVGHKEYEGDQKTPEGTYRNNGCIALTDQEIDELSKHTRSEHQLGYANRQFIRMQDILRADQAFL
ncbi:MAG: L,D-transpeptidase family protein [Flavitalea sp.]